MNDIDILRDENFDPTIKADKWYIFEAMDRAHMVMGHINDAFCNHPALDEEEAKLAQDAINNIMEIYQRMGRKMDDFDDGC
jgi:hypothetical protein